MKRAIFCLVLLALLIAYAVEATRYQIEVTRESQDLYKIVGTDIYIKTRYCYVYAYYEDAILDDSEMWIYFVDDDEKCDVARIIH